MKIAEESLKNKPKDRKSIYRVKFTFYVRDILDESSSTLSRWFDSNEKDLLNTNKNHFSCVIHAIAMGIYSFIQSNVIELKQKGNEADNITQEHVPLNPIISLLTLGGGCFGKVYKCVKRRIAKLRRHSYKANEAHWKSLIEFRKYMHCLVMAPKEKKILMQSQLHCWKETEDGFSFPSGFSCHT